MTVGVFTLGQQSKAAHAATGQTVVQKITQSNVNSGKPDTTETGTEVKGTEADAPGGHQDANSVNETSDKGSEPKGTETDGPGGHQDPQGANVDHQFNGAE